MSTINVQLIKAKENIIHETLVSERIEACLITETLLRSDINDMWVQTPPLKINKFRMSTVNRQQGGGGGLALIHNKEVKV